MRPVLAGVLLVTLPALFGQQQEFEELGAKALDAVRTGRFEEAVPAYRRMLILDPANGQVRFDYALALNRLGRARESLHILGTPQAADALALAGANYRLLAEPRTAAGVLRRAFAMAPNSAVAYDLGLALLDMEANAEAERVFGRFPDNARCLVGVGLVAYATGRNDQAVRAFARAAELEPDAADIHASLGDAQFSTGAFEEAAKAYEQAMRLDARSADYRVKAARNLARLNREEDAIVQLRNALRLDPMQPDANAELARILADKAPEQERRTYIERAIAAEPGKSNGFYQLMLRCRVLNDAACVEFARRNHDHLRATGGAVKVEMSSPSVIVEGPADEKRWGRYQFPEMHRMEDGRLIVFVHVEADSATAYGAPKRAFVSSDDGISWREDAAAAHEPYGLRIGNGDWLRTDTPPALAVKDLSLPERAGAFTMYGAEYSVFPMRALSKELRLMFLQRYSGRGWKQEASELDDLNGFRYTVEGRFPRIWWGDMRRAGDGSLVAVTYPRIGPEQPFRFGSAAYRSIDRGRTWKLRGPIPYAPDTAADPLAAKRGGFTEPALATLGDSSLYTVLRTTDGNGVGPMYASRSVDLGRTWTKPKVIAPYGVLPRLLRLDNGVLVLSSGRPGVQLRFSAKGTGDDWGDPWDLLPVTAANPQTDTCGYTSLTPIDRDSFLITYSWFLKPDSEGKTRKAILARRIRVTKTISSGK